jgi:hypothetical protein
LVHAPIHLHQEVFNSSPPYRDKKVVVSLCVLVRPSVEVSSKLNCNYKT